MKIAIAPDSFKGSCSAENVCRSIAEGVWRVFPQAELIQIPIADGGEGFVQALIGNNGGNIVKTKVLNPLGIEIDSFFGVLGDTAIIEMAAASGLELISEQERNPLITTTFGTGQLIKAALEQGFRKIVVGIGGSATNDGGVGMAQALGVSFQDKNGEEITFGGKELDKIFRIDISAVDARLKETSIMVACDVDNPLCGKTGASFVFGPQKGATDEDVIKLDKCLAHYAEMVQKTLNIDIKMQKGAGAAGGLGAGLLAFTGAKMASGADIVLDTVLFDKRIKDCDLVITGEGMMDGQTVHGKAAIVVAHRAAGLGIPVFAVVGCVGNGVEAVYKHGINRIATLMEYARDKSDAMSNARYYIAYATECVMKNIRDKNGKI